LFGKPEFALFGETSAAMREYLEKVASLAGWMGAGAMVFGSPKNRIVPPAFSSEEADAAATRFFRDLGGHAATHGTAFCLEPNPVAYGGNYLTHTADAARIASSASSAGIRIQIDAGELAMNAENTDEVIDRNISLIGHVHISQANLDSFEHPWEGHARLAAALARNGYGGSCSIEMKRQPDGLASVEKAIRFALETYAPCLE
jgi:D-psicose/D-tagatose/L-ribulose 3-epimerase